MDLYARPPPADSSRTDANTGLEESMWRLSLRGGSGSGVSNELPYPERPGELYPERPGVPDCVYYMRTGVCGYADKCQYNHPRDRWMLNAGIVRAAEFPERLGQPLCKFYTKTGSCKFGYACKYHHPRQGGGSFRAVSLNFYGHPLRPGEKECAYYIKTGHCKFGSTCKFHHPQPSGASVPSPAPAFYPTVQAASVPSAQEYPPSASWQVTRPSVLPGSYMQGSYPPMVLSPGVIPVQGWSTYPAPLSPVLSPGTQQTVQAGAPYGVTSQPSPMPAYGRPYSSVSASVDLPSADQREHSFPERPGEPECQYYLRTGDCKYGASCKYHHPSDWSVPKSNCILNPLGYPLRPGVQPCSYYIQHGQCKFGPTCRYDHPMGLLGYSPSASSLLDMPVAPFPDSLSHATLAPSSSSSNLPPELMSPNELISATMPENTSTGSISSIFSGRAIRHYSIIEPQAPVSACGSIIGAGSSSSN